MPTTTISTLGLNSASCPSPCSVADCTGCSPCITTSSCPNCSQSTTCSTSVQNSERSCDTICSSCAVSVCSDCSSISQSSTGQGVCSNTPVFHPNETYRLIEIVVPSVVAGLIVVYLLYAVTSRWMAKRR